jgi:cysteinyl-tRNA synthetase
VSLELYNSLKRKKETFVPLEPGKVRMYVCGPTVYNYLHIGNFRGPVVFNLLRHWLEESGYQVTFALNFTDVDDKIINRALDEGVSSSEISEKYIQAYKDDFKALGLSPHEMNPKVTDHMTEIIDMVQTLVEKKKAYVSNRDVLYSIESFPEYGKLSGRNVEDLRAGARVEVDETKQNPMDFALWKSAKPDEVAWDSPWGKGRPGWHIECSAMVKKIFGDRIDIHGGGMDLIFPHHENEIAQSEGCSGQQFVNYWIHVNMLNFSGQKMSKSLGNIVSLREFLKDHHPEIYKFMILSSHYRSVSEFGEETLARSVSGLARIYSCLALLESLMDDFEKTESFLKSQYQNLKDLRSKARIRKSDFESVVEKLEATAQSKMKEFFKRGKEALDDDLNTPIMMAMIFDLVRDFNSQFKRGQKISDKQYLLISSAHILVKYFGGLQSLFMESPSQFLRSLDLKILHSKGISPEKVEALVKERSTARQEKNFIRSDEIRAELSMMGINVSDTPQGSFWEAVKS